MPVISCVFTCKDAAAGLQGLTCLSLASSLWKRSTSSLSAFRSSHLPNQAEKKYNKMNKHKYKRLCSNTCHKRVFTICLKLLCKLHFSLSYNSADFIVFDIPHARKLTHPELTPSMDRAPWSVVHLLPETRSSSACQSHPEVGAPSPSASHYGHHGWTPPGGETLDQDSQASGRLPPGTNLGTVSEDSWLIRNRHLPSAHVLSKWQIALPCSISKRKWQHVDFLYDRMHL